MNIYVLHGCDKIYGGLNDLEEWSMEECRGTDEAIEIATDMSYDVINSYDEITDILKERAEDYLSYDIEEGKIQSESQQEEAFYNYYNELVRDDVAYSVAKLDSSYSLEEYEEMLARGYTYEELIDEFGEEEY